MTTEQNPFADEDHGIKGYVYSVKEILRCTYGDDTSLSVPEEQKIVIVSQNQLWIDTFDKKEVYLCHQRGK